MKNRCEKKSLSTLVAKSVTCQENFLVRGLLVEKNSMSTHISWVQKDATGLSRKLSRHRFVGWKKLFVNTDFLVATSVMSQVGWLKRNADLNATESNDKLIEKKVPQHRFAS